MRIRKLARLSMLALALGGLGLAGCDGDDNNTAHSGTGTSTPGPDAPTASRRPATTRAIRLDNSADLTASFKDVSGPVKPDAAIAQVIQTLPLFNHPQSCAVSATGRYLFVSNSGAIVSNVLGPSVQFNKGAVSKLEIDADGRLRLVQLQFINRLHAPTGIAILNKSTPKFPQGALFICSGMTAGLDEKGEQITDIMKFNPGVGIYDPDNGNMLGFLPMGPNRAVAKSLGHPVLAPAGICFDSQGDLYVADSGNTGKDLDPQVTGRPGIFRISNQLIDVFAQDKESNARVPFAIVRHIPAALFFSASDDGIYWTTCDGQPPIEGGVFQIARQDFGREDAHNIMGGAGGALLGVTTTPSGNLIASQIYGELKYMESGKRVLGTVAFEENAQFATPADFKLMTTAKGYQVLYIPEQEPNSIEAWTQRIRVVLLPTGL
jgi:hypothetical protein